jgi:hypothetical protein
MKDTFNDYLEKAQKMNSSKIINEGYMRDGEEYSSDDLKAQIIDYLNEIDDINDLLTIENFVESKISGDTSMRFDDYGDGD